jgi:hypothetical protein
MKKAIPVLLAVIMAFGTFGCTGSSTSNPDVITPTAPPVNPTPDTGKDIMSDSLTKTIKFSGLTFKVDPKWIEVPKDYQRFYQASKNTGVLIHTYMNGQTKLLLDGMPISKYAKERSLPGNGYSCELYSFIDDNLKEYFLIGYAENRTGFLIYFRQDKESFNEQNNRTINAFFDSVAFDPAAATIDYDEADNQSGSGESGGTTTTPPAPVVKTYREGIYKVGTDLPAGEYRVTASAASTQAYVCVYSDTSKNNIVGNEIFNGRYYVTVYDGQVLEVNRATFVVAAEASYTETTSLKEGMYLVGKDCPAGEYRLEASSGWSGYYCIYNSSDANHRIVSNNIFSSNDYVVVKAGQYLLLSQCTGKLQ